MGNAYVTGKTNSTDFPTTDYACDKSYNGTGGDCFILKLNQTGSKLIYSTYIGGDKLDAGEEIKVDSIGNAFITGITMGSNFPITPGAYDTSYNGRITDVFVLKLNHNGSAIIYSTFVGGGETDSARSIVLDLSGNAFVTGHTYSTNFPTTLNSYDESYNGVVDAFMFKVNWNGSNLIYSTYLGGNSIDYAWGIVYDPSNNIYITGFTNSSDFIITPETYQSPYDKQGSVFVQKFSFRSIINITALTLLKNSTPTNLIYSRFSTYTFRVNITDTESISDLELVRLNFDPGGLNIQLLWTRATGQFSKIFDPKKYIILEPSSNAFNDSIYKWTINFNVIFNWNYPDENFNDVQAYATSAILSPAWFNATEFYHVENDLVFNGSLSVTGDNNRTIGDGELVRGGERLNWTGLTVVYENTTDIYPPADEFNVTLWDEADNSWVDSPLSGENFTIDAAVDLATDLDGNIHIINITRIPPECDKTNEKFMIKIDGDNVIFSNPIPNKNIWQTTSYVDVGINIIDIGGGFVNGSSVKYSFSTDNGTNWTEWIGFPKLKSGVSVNPQEIVIFPDGKNNLVKWKAEDSVGNGPVESEEYRIFVDTEELLFSNGYPTEKNESPTENVEVGITISDVTSGVDASTVEYAISINSGASWTAWIHVSGLNSGNSINVTFNLIFPNGTSNRIKWRATDIAGNGPMESKSYIVIVNKWLQTLKPRVKLWAPENGSIISSIKPTLSWSVEYEGNEILSYDVYLDTNEAPVEYEKCPNIYFLPQGTLEDNKTYYWKVVPWAGAVRCPESETWSFTVNRDYRPRIELKLTVNPPYLEQVPGDVVSVQATVFNLGELTDTISLSVHVPADADIIALVNEPSTMDAISEGTAEFNITVTIAESAKKGEVVLTLVAVSGKAAEYDLVVEENAELTVKIFGIDKPETDRSSTLFKSLNILFIIIIIIIILALAIYVNKRRKCDKEKKSNKEAVTLKPGEFPTAVISVGQPPTVAQLPGSAAGNVGEQSNTLTSSIPVLASSPSTVQAPASQQIPQSPQLPQLPPAQSQATKFEAGETTSVPIITTTTSIPTPVVSASETVPKQQQVSAQEPRETDNAQPQEQDKEVSEHQNKNSEP